MAETLSASALMRSLGLLVDGPVIWGSPVRSRTAGVFVVEAADPTEDAPLDHRQIRRWLERVPDLRVDGKPTTPHALANRLAAFWVPSQQILYVGRSARAIGARVAALYATELGHSKPYPGGSWLKTLSILPTLRIWYAETEAHEEFEDALLTQFSAHVDGAVPFANMRTAAGGHKPHGLSGELREPPAPRSAGRQQQDQRAAEQKQRRTVAQPRARRSRAGTVSGRPAPGPTYLSQQGRDKLVAELDELRNRVRPEVIARVRAARELGDLRENADYEAARNEQSFLEGRILAVERLLNTTEVAPTLSAEGVVAVGSSVTVEVDGETEVYVLVGSAEADPAAGRISTASPVGRALLGKRAGDEVTAELPVGSVRYLVRGVR